MNFYFCECYFVSEYLVRHKKAGEDFPQKTEFGQTLREVIKKNWKKAVRLTAWVDPPPPPKRSGKCEKFTTSCHI